MVLNLSQGKFFGLKLQYEPIYHFQEPFFDPPENIRKPLVLRKTDKFFLNLEKQNAINTTVTPLIDDAKDITDLKEINACICKFYKNLFKKNASELDLERDSFLNSTALPNLSSKSVYIREGEITEKDLITALKRMPNR